MPINAIDPIRNGPIQIRNNPTGQPASGLCTIVGHYVQQHGQPGTHLCSPTRNAGGGGGNGGSAMSGMAALAKEKTQALLRADKTADPPAVKEKRARDAAWQMLLEDSHIFFHYDLQTWQHEAEAVHGLHGSHAYCNR